MSFFSSIFKPLVSIAAPIAGFALGGPAGAAVGGGLGGLLSGGGLKGATIGAATGGLGGLFAGGLGTVAGAPLSGGIGPTAGSGILGGLTRAVPSLAAPLSSMGSSFGTGGSMFGGSGNGGLSSILGGALAMNSAEKMKDEYLKQIGRAGQEYQPYQQSGLVANQRLSDALANGRLGGQFTADKFREDPGYQFRLAEGQKGLDRRLAAGGNYFSGDALKAANDYAQGMASQEYQNAFNRNQSEEQNLYNMLYGQQGVGLNAGQQLAKLREDEANARNYATYGKSNGLSQILGGFL